MTITDQATAGGGVPFFPGGTALTRLAVYDWEAADGQCGGAPHMHTASTEAYLVIGGRGRVETLHAGGHDVHELAVGDLVWFSPGTIHRLINDGKLDLLVVMANSGLPEAGDAVLTFLPEILEDPEEYRRTAQLPVVADGGSGVEPASREYASPEHVEREHAARERAARARRDAAMAGYRRLRDAARAGDWQPVEDFHAQAVRLIQGRVPQWRELWEQRVAAEAAGTDAWLTELAAGRYGHFGAAAVGRSRPKPGAAWGMCGLLQTWAPGQAAGLEDAHAVAGAVNPAF